ncbi:MAG: hypothetical protein RL112_1553 [Planctomycetota bacterium]|jgi:signal transduction histidine kinase
MKFRNAEWQGFVPGLGAIAVVGAPVLWVAARADSPFTTLRVWSFLATIAASTVVFVALAVRAPSERASHLLVAVQSVLGLAANWLIPMVLPGVALTGILLAVAAGAFARWPRRAALACIAAQTVLLLAIYALAHGWAVGIAVLAASGYGLMQVVLESNWRHVLLERARSIELEAAMRDLRSTQAMLAETARADQRSEIAGDLHDAVGHQLVALGLQLDAAIDDPPAQARARIAESRELVREALASVRATVAGLHDRDAVDLAMALRSLATEGPGPRVEVQIDAAAPCMSLDLAETLLRCAQEALTNARKHAGASRVDIELRSDRIVIRDDGRGLGASPAGFGLQSMSARCAARGCRFRIDSSTRGTTVEISWDAGGPA